MKTNKIVLSAITLLVAAGSAFALNNSKRANIHPVYTTNGAFTGCYNTAANICSSGTPSTGSYYTVNSEKITATRLRID